MTAGRTHGAGRSDEPLNLNSWLEAGFSADEARAWCRRRIPLRLAIAWQEAGVLTGLEAAGWAAAGIGPDGVGAWRAAGIDATRAVRCREMGYDLAKARELKRRGVSPEQEFAQHVVARGGAPITTNPAGPVLEALRDAGAPPQVQRRYALAQWFDQEAIAWARQGVDAVDARLWRDLGLRPAEGSRLTRQGCAPMQVIRDWWRAGIPYDELADWLGAGLTADEAAAQRARGITAEQAAALRALRDTGDDPEPPPPISNTQMPGQPHPLWFHELKGQVHRLLVQRLGATLYDGRRTRGELEAKVRITLQEVLATSDSPLTVSDRARVAQELANEILGAPPP
jgi:hypothetical protein